MRGARAGAADWIIVVCCGVFILILALAAWWDQSIRWLHFFQAWLYVATALLVLQRERWGYFLGAVTAAFWNYVTLFLNNFFHAGLEQLELLLSTGQMPRADLIISVPAVAAHFVMIGCCLWGYARLPKHPASDAGRLAVSAVISIGYFAGIMALFQPRYLVMFTRLLHPHLSLGGMEEAGAEARVAQSPPTPFAAGACSAFSVGFRSRFSRSQ